MNVSDRRKIELMLEAEALLSRLNEIFTGLSEVCLEEDDIDQSKLFLGMSDGVIEDFMSVQKIVGAEVVIDDDISNQ